MQTARNRRPLTQLAGCSLAVFCPFALAQDGSPAGKITYDYLYVDANSGSNNSDFGDNSNVTAVGVGGSMLYKENWLLVTDYAARFVHPENQTNEYYTLRPGVGYKYSYNEQLDFSSRARFGVLWSTVTNDITNQQISSDTASIYGLDLTITYRPIKTFELNLTGELSRSRIIDEDIWKLSAEYWWEPRFAVGVFYTYRDAQVSSTSEGGVLARYAY
ncbi:porin family protein [Vibrio profundum]|uniref:porin family protein n=1 Tax=Vibrio profundum TaxID=2910247 RepID=UPI003D10DD89